ncbi:MAG: bifunctional phosphopantothenoylcysteine decarboxylase/phosphopantothenate--cysteine ligase CoaBC [Chitinophagaceae bacterium]|nr:bifunctional phosphopantothenoylcysteine decarboxylase/phosphopantothenate--cysteine ligase CoaBC [Chitinophagaceae bacterium]
MLKDKNILLGITGSIAAYKSITLVRLLVKQGAHVKVVMTPAAKDFVSPLVLATLSKNEALVDLANDSSWANHAALGRWAHLMIIAPLSCNTLGKMAHGLCDNLLLAVYLSATCPVMIAPAMDEDMWKHPSTKENLKRLISFGNTIIPVESGELASGLVGEGRMAEPETILKHISDFFLNSQQPKDFAGKKIMITAGPTYEKIDPVRFIGNHSSGKMGIAIAEELSNRGGEVVLIMGPSSQPIPAGISKLIQVQTAEEMYQASAENFTTSDIAVMSAAVADYTPVNEAIQKIKKDESSLTIELKKTKDILASLGALKTSKQILVGFALETNNEEEYALKKLNSKNADMIVLNSLNNSGAGFGVDTNRITIFTRSGSMKQYPLKSKKDVAADIADAIKTVMNA